MGILGKMFGRKDKLPPGLEGELEPGQMPGLEGDKELGMGFGEEPGIGAGPNPSAGMPAQTAPTMESPGMSSGFQQQPRPMGPPMQPPLGKDIEIVSAKLDALKAKLDSIDQRLANLERIASQGI